jgi:hypothetical protein
MKKIFLTAVISIFSVLPALAHVNGNFHAHPHGAKLNPADTTMLIVLIVIVMAMIILPIIVAIIKFRKH